jgi:hypothetical protein
MRFDGSGQLGCHAAVEQVEQVVTNLDDHPCLTDEEQLRITDEQAQVERWQSQAVAQVEVRRMFDQLFFQRILDPASSGPVAPVVWIT